jgi:hypothetical protein
MKPTPAQAAEIMRWGHQHRRLLRVKKSLETEVSAIETKFAYAD